MRGYYFLRRLNEARNYEIIPRRCAHALLDHGAFNCTSIELEPCCGIRSSEKTIRLTLLHAAVDGVKPMLTAAAAHFSTICARSSYALQALYVKSEGGVRLFLLVCKRADLWLAFNSILSFFCLVWQSDKDVKKERNSTKNHLYLHR